MYTLVFVTEMRQLQLEIKSNNTWIARLFTHECQAVATNQLKYYNKINKQSHESTNTVFKRQSNYKEKLSSL